jgi:uncharacterized protein
VKEVVQQIGYARLVKYWPRWRKGIRSVIRKRGLDFLVQWLPKEHPELCQEQAANQGGNDHKRKQKCSVYLMRSTMMDLKNVSALLKRHQADLHQRGVKSLAVFGSLARGEATPASDIDVLVEFDRPVGLFEFIRLKLYLEELIGRHVDLVTPDALRPAMRAEILSEAVRVA